MSDVVHVTPLGFGADGAWGGGERFAFEVARAQASVRPTRLVTFGEAARVAHEGDLEIVVLKRRAVIGNLMNPVSERLLGAIVGARVVHVHQWHTLLTSATVMLTRLAGQVPFVTDHGGSGPNPLRRLRPARSVEALLAVSEYSAGLMPEFRGKERIVYCGVDTDHFAPPSAGGPPRRGVVFVGRILPHKGLDVLVEAIDSRLALDVYGRVGDQALFERLRVAAAGKDIRFHTDASDADILSAYQGAKVAVLPSVGSRDGVRLPKAELFGIALAEAMACGTPAVCSNVGGMPEVVVDGVTGAVVPDGDSDLLRAALHGVVDAPAGRWREMSSAALDRVRAEFTWNRCAQRCLEAYDAAS